jgi:hypothetical protein
LVLHRSRLRCFWSRCLTSFSDYATTVLAAINMRWQSWFKRHAWLPWILAALRPASIFMYSTTPLQMKGPSRYLLEGERIFPVICPCMELQVPPPVRQ